MKKTCFKSKKLLILSVVLVISLLSVSLAVMAAAADSANNVWTFSDQSVKDSLYIQEHFTDLPRSFEAEVNFPEGSYGSSSPIIANWPNSDTRDSFGFQIRDNGSPAIYYYQAYYDAETSTTMTDNNIMVKFNYSVIGKGWVRIAVSCETESGSSVYKLFVDGELVETIYDYPYVHTIDPVFSQNSTRELSIGNDGKNYFKGQLRSLAVYRDPLTEAEAKNTAKDNMQSGDENLMAYYDATMSGNSEDFIKDQTGSGHHAKKAFFERTSPIEDYAYSFAFIGDTQFLVEKDVNDKTTGADRNYAKSIYDWIAANKDSKNIQRVFGLGDITDDNNEAQWLYALDLHKKLVNAGVPFSITPGNHDDYTTPAANYNKYFAELAGFVKNGDAPDGDNANYGYYIEGRLENYYTNFTVGNTKYMVIAIQYGAPDDILAWANEVVAANSDRKVIVITHSLFDSKGEWAYADTTYQTTTSRKYLNNGIDIWNEFISLHSNIIMAFAGHISSDTIKHGQSVGVNGNVVNTFLINPQGFDKATAYDTGMVAMFYFSEDGSRVQVEYISTVKTVRAQDADPSSDDILYHERDVFSFEMNTVGTGTTKTEYGIIPNSYIPGNAFAVFEDGEFVSSHPTWNSVTAKVADMLAADSTRDIQILLLRDYDNKNDPQSPNALSYANGTLTVDLGKHTFTRNESFLNFENSGNTAESRVILKNGIVRSGNGAVIETTSGVWSLTAENVTFGFAANSDAPSGAFYKAWSEDASAAAGSANITLNNCTFDLSVNLPSSATLFNLSDTADAVDTVISVNGGKILVNKAVDLNSVTFYILDEADSIIFGDYSGEALKLQTPVYTPASGEIEHYQGKLPMADGYGCFVELSNSLQISQAGAKASVYELTSLTFNSGDLSATADITENPGYLSAIDYPFFVFDKSGRFYGGFDTLLGTNSGAMGEAIETALKNSDTAYIIMRRDYTMTKSESYSDLAYANGTVVIDMCGYSLIADSTRGGTYMFDSIAKCDESGNAITYPSYFVFKNGSIKTHSASVIRFQSVNKKSGIYHDVSKKLISWTFDGVTFGLVSGSTYDRFFHVSNSSVNKASDTSAPIAPVSLNFNDCVFDLQTVQPNPSSNNFYVFRTNFIGTTDLKVDIRINGGKILAKALDYKVSSVAKYICLDNFSDVEGSTMYFGKGSDGEYMKVVIPESAAFTIGVEDPASKTITKYTLENNITKYTENGSELTFELVSKGIKRTYALVQCASTPYGDIPEEYANADEYPILVFGENGKFVGAYKNLLTTSGAMANAVTSLNDDASNKLDSKTGKYSGVVYVLLRKTYTMTSSETYSNYEAAKGTVVIDLGGNSIIADSNRAKDKYMFDSDAKSNITYPSYFIFKNGSIRTYTAQVMRFRAANKSTDISKNLISWTFEGITFGLVDGSTYDRFLHISNSGGGSTVAPLELNFNDCIFDLQSVAPSKPFYIFRTNFVDSTDIKADIRINGGKILAKNPASSSNGIYLDNFADTFGSTMLYGPGSDGEYLKIVVPQGNTFGIYVNDPVNSVSTLYNLSNNITKQTVNGTDIKFYKETSSASGDVYAFCFDTKYGIAPAKYEDTEDYPFFVFNSAGTLKTATDVWATDNGTSALSSSKAVGDVILVRRDYVNEGKQYNNLSHTKDLTIDLNGFTITNTSYTFFMAQKKAQSGNEQDSKITVKNGTVIIGKRALMKLDTSTTTTSGKYGFTFVFDGVTVKLSGDVTSTNKAFICENEFAAGDPIQYCDITFNDCVFDLSDANEAMTVFDVSNNCCKLNAVINGGKIITSEHGVTLWKDYTSAPGTVIAHAESSLTFGKSEIGSYTELTVPVGTELPIAQVNGGALGFVKIGEENGIKVYTLAPADATSFVPMSSITLDRDLILNVYVPAVQMLTSFTLDGVEYTAFENLDKATVNDKGYYHIKITLDAKYAARDISLTAKVLLGDKTASATFSFGIIRYAEKVIGGGNTVEIQLVKDVLSYIRAAYAYFGTENESAIDKIDAILGEGYDADNMPELNGSAEAPSAGLNAVTLVLSATPSIRFYISDAEARYEFFINGNKVAVEEGTDKNGAYLAIDVYAYAMCETVNYKINGVDSGSFHINSYYTFVTTDEEYRDNAELINLVLRFAKYCESARVYKIEITK